MNTFKDKVKSSIVMASKNTTENMVLFSLILYGMTSDLRLIYFCFGLLINYLMNIIIRMEGSLDIQTIFFFITFVLTSNFLSESVTINSFFMLMSLLLVLFNITSSEFSSTLVGSMVGICIGFIYAWLIIKNMSVSNVDIPLNYPDGPTVCEAVEKINYPKEEEDDIQNDSESIRI